MSTTEAETYAAFSGHALVASGSLPAVLTRVKKLLEKTPSTQVLFFQDRTGKQIDFDLRGTVEAVLARLPTHPMLRVEGAQTGRGRPRLGVVSREVTLLPRHWDYLEQQPNGISAALRRLVDASIKRDPLGDRARLSRDAAGRFMTAVAGNLPGFEEASRALFSGDQSRFALLTAGWPAGIRRYLSRLTTAFWERAHD